MKKIASLLRLSLVALSALALPAHAGVIVFNPTGGSWSTGSDGLITQSSVSAAALPGASVQGVNVYGSATAIPLPPKARTRTP